MKTLAAAAFALTLAGGAASANPCNPYFGPCSYNYGTDPYPSFYQPRVGSSFPDADTLIDAASGRGLLRNQNLQLQNELLRRQLQQGR